MILPDRSNPSELLRTCQHLDPDPLCLNQLVTSPDEAFPDQGNLETDEDRVRESESSMAAIAPHALHPARLTLKSLLEFNNCRRLSSSRSMPSTQLPARCLFQRLGLMMAPTIRWFGTFVTPSKPDGLLKPPDLIGNT